jgi:hypothetical protein
MEADAVRRPLLFERPTVTAQEKCYRRRLGVFCTSGTAGPAEPPGCSGTVALPNSSIFVWDDNHDVAVDDLSGGTRLRRYDDAYVDSEGYIMLRRDGDCRVLRNGGCHRRMRRMDPLMAGIRVFASVVTLATHFGGGHYHFPLESLVGLARANASLADCLAKGADRCSMIDGGPHQKCAAPGLSRGEGCRIHVSRRDSFHSAWLSLAGSVPSKQVIFGQVFARQLWVPQLGRCEAHTSG